MKFLVTPFFLSVFVLCGCAGSHQIETDLYFGFSKPGGIIPEKDWNIFVEQYISPVYPNGFTIIPAQGKWLDTSTHILISEPSAIVIAIHKKDKLLSSKIDDIIANYKRLFQQQAVLRVDKKAIIHY